MSDTGGPYVQLAAFCNMTLRDDTGTLSIIRMVDRYTITGETEKMQPSPVAITLAVLLKSGFMQQNAKVQIMPHTPTGVELPVLEFSVLFEGQERGVGIVFPMTMVLPEEGLYWFDVAVDNQLMTRIPLRLIYQRVAIGTGQGPAS